MFPSSHVSVRIDLPRIRENVAEIVTRTGVPVIAVVKADAYGLGVERIAPAIADLVDRFCVFGLQEAVAADLWNRTGKRALAIGPTTSTDPADYQAAHARPSVSTLETARALRAADPVLCVDTGQQRFACPIDGIDEVIESSQCREAFTHATNLDQVRAFADAIMGKFDCAHAAGSSLLDEPSARFDAVRPGLALYHGAVRVTTRLVEVRRGNGPAGYSGFTVPCHGIILAGYSNGLRTGPCLINGRDSRILEVGMQSAFVEVAPTDRRGDEVVLLGDGLTEQQVASAWRTSPHEALLRLGRGGMRDYAPAR